MSLSGLFESLGAPLVNVRWSWGAVRATDGAVFLRVWQDQCKKIDGLNYARILSTSAYAGREDNPGYVERLNHIALIREGAVTYMIMCRAKDPGATPRSIASFNREYIFASGKLIEHEGYVWLQLVDKQSGSELR